MTNGGAIGTMAAYHSSGTQALLNATDINDDDDVTSAFNPNHQYSKVLLFGTNFVEVQPSTVGSSLGATQTFTFSNDVDAIGDMYMQFNFSLSISTGASSLKTLGDLALARVIDRCEISVGNSSWQVLEGADIVALAMTTLSGPNYNRFATKALGVDTSGTGGPHALGSLTTSVSQEVWVPLNTFTKGTVDRAHLVAGSPYQTVRVKLSYTADPGFIGGMVSAASDVQFTARLFARQHIMTTAERDQIRDNVIAKPLHLTQHAERSVPAGTSSVTVELDAFSLLTSHLLISVENTSGAPSSRTVSNAELMLNTSSHSGTLTGDFMSWGAQSAMSLEANTTALSGIGSSLPATFTSRHVYCFPMASRPYGTDGVPLNRFDAIRLKVNLGQSGACVVHVTSVGVSTGVYKDGAASLMYFS